MQKSNLRIKTCALQMDAIETVNIKTDSTFIIALEAMRRGYDIYHYLPNDLFYLDGEVFARMRKVALKNCVGNHFEWLEGSQVKNLKQIDVIWLRQDPPFDMSYITNTHLLDIVSKFSLVFNNPRAVRNSPEKLLVTQFKDLGAPTLIARDIQAIKDFRAVHKDIIVKPLFGNGGEGVFFLNEKDPNLDSLLEMFFAKNSEPLMIQKYLKSVTEGDKRIILIDGEPKACINRIPKAGEVRANLHTGGKYAPSSLTEREKYICAQIGGYLRDNGLLFVGIDVIGDCLTEINVTSPTCILEANEMYGCNLEADIWNAIESR